MYIYIYFILLILLFICSWCDVLSDFINLINVDVDVDVLVPQKCFISG